MTKERILIVDSGGHARALAKELLASLKDLEVVVLDEPPTPEVFKLYNLNPGLEPLRALDATCLKRPVDPQSNFLARKGGHYGAGRKG